MNLRWFLSRTMRQATAMRKQVYHLLCAQRDLLAPPAIEAMNASLAEFSVAIKSDTRPAALKAEMEKLEKAVDQWLKPYPFAAIRENVEVFLVTVVVALAIRTFFAQPFKIPTGSMQPTLFGVTDQNMISQPDFKIPTGFKRLKEWLEGTSYVHVTAEHDGQLEDIQDPVKLLIFGLWQKLVIGGHTQTIMFPPDYGAPPVGTLAYRAWVGPNQRYHDRQYRKGDDVIKLRINSGDYLFVDRLTFNFRRPQRGEIIVFGTGGMDETARERYDIPDGQVYIKRLVGLGGETLRIGKDHHLVIDGKRLDITTPGFNQIYSYNPAKGETNAYSGHAPDANNLRFFTNGESHTIATNRFMVMGDNTYNSQDSRYFGDVDTGAIIGKSWFVYWPLTSRFGLGYR